MRISCIKRGLGVSVFVNFFDLFFRYQFGHGAKYLEDSIPQFEVWLCTMSHPNNVFHSGRFGVLLSKKYEGRICPKTVLGQLTQVFCSGQNYFQLDKTKVLDKFR